MKISSLSIPGRQRNSDHCTQITTGLVCISVNVRSSDHYHHSFSLSKIMRKLSEKCQNSDQKTHTCPYKLNHKLFFFVVPVAVCLFVFFIDLYSPIISLFQCCNNNNNNKKFPFSSFMMIIYFPFLYHCVCVVVFFYSMLLNE